MKKQLHGTRNRLNGGHPEAQASLAWMYENGKGIEADLKEAIYWYQKNSD
jgi:Sel1 repeat.